MRRPKPPIPPKPPKRKAKDTSYNKVESKRVQPKSSMGTKRKPAPMPAGPGKPKKPKNDGKKLMPYDVTKPKNGVKLLPAKPNATAKPKPMTTKPNKPIQIPTKPKPGDTLYKPLPVKPGVGKPGIKPLPGKIGKQDRLKELKTMQEKTKKTFKNRKY